MFRNFPLLLFVVILFSVPVESRSEKITDALTISGHVRLRSELNGKSFAPDVKADNFTLMRTRVGLKLSLAEHVSTFIQFQDSRKFGTEPSTLSSVDNIDLHQGYIRLDGLLGAEGVTLMAGRMEIIFGGQRLIGAVGWHNIGRSFDGARLFIDREKFRAEIWGATVNDVYEDYESRDNSIGGIDLELSRSAEFAPRFYVIAERNNKLDTGDNKLLSRQTLGVHTVGKVGSFDYDIETALQRGIQANSDIDATLFAIAAGYTFDAAGRPRLGFGVDYLSGDNNPTGGDSKTFNTLYPTNHKFYGHMDYFLNIPLHTADRGLIDYIIKAQWKPYSKLMIRADYHIFSYAEDDFNGENYLGNELDLSLTINPRKGVSNVFGFSLFSPGDVFKRTKGEETSYWLYNMLTVSF